MEIAMFASDMQLEIADFVVIHDFNPLETVTLY